MANFLLIGILFFFFLVVFNRGSSFSRIAIVFGYRCSLLAFPFTYFFEFFAHVAHCERDSVDAGARGVLDTIELGSSSELVSGDIVHSPQAAAAAAAASDIPPFSPAAPAAPADAGALNFEDPAAV